MKEAKERRMLLVVAASELALPCLNRLSQWYYMWRSTWSLPEGFQRLDHPKAAVLHKGSPFIHSFVSSVFHRMTVKFVLFVGLRWVQRLNWRTGMPLWRDLIGPLMTVIDYCDLSCGKSDNPIEPLENCWFTSWGQFVTLPAHVNKAKIRDEIKLDKAHAGILQEFEDTISLASLHLYGWVFCPLLPVVSS